MFGRYQRRSDKQKIAEAFAPGNVDGLIVELAPGYIDDSRPLKKN
jgi:hypothetical protein